MRSNTAVDTGSNLASWVLIMYMETPRGLGEFGDILRRYYAGVVGAVGKHHHDFPACVLRRILQRQQQGVVECRFVSCHSRAHGAQNLRPVEGKNVLVRPLGEVHDHRWGGANWPPYNRAGLLGATSTLQR